MPYKIRATKVNFVQKSSLVETYRYDFFIENEE